MMAFLTDGIGWTVLHFLWQGALVGAGTLLILLALRGAAPAYRYAVMGAALLACLIWPAADLATRVAAASSETAEITILKSMRGGQAGLRDSVASDTARAYMGHVVSVWLAGVLLLSMRTMAGLVWVARSANGPAAHRWEQRAAQLAQRMGIERTVRVRLAANLDTPVTAGWRRPLILLPAALAEGMPSAQLDALLAHELAHIRRHDYALHLVQNLIATLLFFHPVVWWLSRRINAERELLADALAARTLGEPRLLAQALAELDRHRCAGTHLMQAATGGELLGRVRALVKPQATALKLHLVIPALAVSVAGLAFAAEAAGDAAGQALTRGALVDFATCSKPEWPAGALAAENTGTVTLKFKIDRSGAVIAGKLIRSSGHLSLDQAAMEGIGKCHFKPAQLNGMPVTSWQTMQYVWTLI